MAKIFFDNYIQLLKKQLMRNMPIDSCTPWQSSHLFAELGLKKCKKVADKYFDTAAN